MNLEEFNETYKKNFSREKITIPCSTFGCLKQETMNKDSARRNIQVNGCFFCRSCCFTEEGRKKIAKATSYERSEDTKQKMAESATVKWSSEWGKTQKKKLSRLAALQNASTKMNKSKRKVLYVSAKNNGLRACNSSGEFIACEDILEKDPTIISYEMQVYYEVNDRSRSLDVLISYENGSIKAVEIKPLKRMTEKDNQLQIEDSRTYAESQGWQFELWTEKELGITSWKVARDRADAYRKEHHQIDYAVYRAEMNRKKAKKHYDAKIANDKVIIFCSYCEEYHVRLRKPYEANVLKNGRYLCIKENGSIVGKQPKKPKESPYGPGLKKCSGPCDRVLALDNFSKGKAKCKECRCAFYKNKNKGTK